MLGPAIPAAAPMSSMLTAWNPRSCTSLVAMDSSSSRREVGAAAARQPSCSSAGGAGSPPGSVGTSSTAVAMVLSSCSNWRLGTTAWCTATLPNVLSAAQQSSSVSAASSSGRTCPRTPAHRAIAPLPRLRS